MENELYPRIYDKDVLELLTVSTEFCVRMEQAAGTELRELVGTLLKILPLLYVKHWCLTIASLKLRAKPSNWLQKRTMSMCAPRCRKCWARMMIILMCLSKI